VLVKKKAGKLTVAGEGAVEKLAASAAGYAISEGAGKFTLGDGKIQLKDASLLLNNQKITAAGTITPADNDMKLNLDLAAAAFDPGALAAMPLRGAMAFQAKLEGTVANPVARGTFSIPAGSFGAIAFKNGRGNFVYQSGVLTLADARATAWDGALALQGDIVPATKRYNLTASGRGVDSELLTEKDIRGRADFDARLSGQGESDGKAEGNFRMGEGLFSGIPFQSMTGDFVKKGEQISFSNIVVNTAAGSFRAEGLTDGPVVRLKRLGEAPAPREAVEKAISDKLNPLKRIFR